MRRIILSLLLVLGSLVWAKDYIIITRVQGNCEEGYSITYVMKAGSMTSVAYKDIPSLIDALNTLYTDYLVLDYTQLKLFLEETNENDNGD